MTAYKIRPLEWEWEDNCDNFPQGEEYVAHSGAYTCAVFTFGGAPHWTWNVLVNSDEIASGRALSRNEARAAAEACYIEEISEHLEPVENNP